MLSSSLFSIALIALLFAQLGGSSNIEHHNNNNIEMKIECPDRCGEMMIFPPFGIGLNCYSHEDFSITCNESSNNNPRPILTKFNLELLEIPISGSTSEGQVTVNLPTIIRACPGRQQVTRVSSVDLGGSPFYFTNNVLVSVGCQGLASIYNETGRKVGGCGSFCSSPEERENRLSMKECYGNQCCQSDISSSDYTASFQRFELETSPKGITTCTTAFIVSKDFVNSNSTLVTTIARDSVAIPVVLGYWDRHHLTDYSEPIMNSMMAWSLIIGGTALGTLLLSCACFWSCWFYKTKEARKEAKLRAKYFKGRLEESSSNRELVYKTKLFTIKELKIATDTFNADRILGEGGQGTVYKGMLTNGQVIAVKRPRTFEEVHWKPFINEVILLSQVNHRNVVKLIGCCLEAKLPLLVYEFIPNGTLSHHIHSSNSAFVLTWDMRVRIAAEAAGAIAYLHSSSTTPIYHRDVKSTNVLLDDKFQAKVSDFGISKAISTDQTHLTTRVQGTIGYLDPEYFRSSKFSEKSDVYSFGVILVELLTGQHPIRTTRLEEEKSLVMYFISAMSESTLEAILDPLVLEGSTIEEVMLVADLAKRCLDPRGIERPTMKEVAMELEGRLRKNVPPMLDRDDGQVSLEIEDVITRSSTILMSNSASTSMVDDLGYNDEQPLFNMTW